MISGHVPNKGNTKATRLLGYTVSLCFFFIVVLAVGPFEFVGGCVCAPALGLLNPDWPGLQASCFVRVLAGFLFYVGGAESSRTDQWPIATNWSSPL